MALCSAPSTLSTSLRPRTPGLRALTAPPRSSVFGICAMAENLTPLEETTLQAKSLENDDNRLTKSGFETAQVSSDNARALRAIARLTQKLDVSFCVAAAARQRNDVIVFEKFLAPAFDAPALVALPNKHLHVLGNRLAARRVQSFISLKRLDFPAQFVEFLLFGQNRMLYPEDEFVRSFSRQLAVAFRKDPHHRASDDIDYGMFAARRIAKQERKALRLAFGVIVTRVNQGLLQCVQVFIRFAVSLFLFDYPVPIEPVLWLSSDADRFFELDAKLAVRDRYTCPFILF